MARDFDGSTQYGTVTHNTRLDVQAGDFTSAGWVWFDSFPSFACIHDTAVRYLSIFIGSATTIYLGVGGTESGVQGLAITLATGQWYHAALRRIGSNVDFIVDGSAARPTMSLSGTTTNTDNLVFADNPSTGGSKLDGKLAEWALWNAGLSDAEVSSLALGFSPLLVKPASLRGYWPMLGGYSPENEVTAGMTMALTGSPPAFAHPRVFYPSRAQYGKPISAAPGGVFSLQHIYRHVAGIGA